MHKNHLKNLQIVLANANERYRNGGDELVRKIFNNSQSYQTLARKAWKQIAQIKNEGDKYD